MQASVLGTGEADQAPEGYTSYETLIILRPTLSDQERDLQLASFETFLRAKSSQRIKLTLKGRQRLAYPIKKFTEGIYVLYTYDAKPATSQAVQRLLSTPVARGEANVLRHMTFRT